MIAGKLSPSNEDRCCGRYTGYFRIFKTDPNPFHPVSCEVMPPSCATSPPRGDGAQWDSSELPVRKFREKLMTGYTSFSQTGDAHAAGAEPQRASDPDVSALPERSLRGLLTGNLSFSQPGDAHAAGAKPPRASIKNRKYSGEAGFSLKDNESGAP
jgi:hypothetical protein